MLLQASNLTKRFRRGDGTEFLAVDNVSLSVDSGEFITIVGRSGSGKTTLINLLTGLLTPDSGEILFDGRNLRDLNEAEQSAWRNSAISYIPQGQSLLPTLTVLENVRLPFFLRPRAGDGGGVAHARELLAKFGISHLERSYPQSLSGGEMRRTAIARALFNRPRLIVADEPTSDLDLQTTLEISAILVELAKQGAAVIAVTHDPEVAVNATRTLTMTRNRIETEAAHETA